MYGKEESVSCSVGFTAMCDVAFDIDDGDSEARMEEFGDCPRQGI